MLVLFISILINTNLGNVLIQENQDSTEYFKIHFGEPKIILRIPEAEDAVLESFEKQSFCEVKQQTVQTQTQQFTILKSDEFKDYEFENDTPLNFRQFIGMVHVNDGMIAITSDSVAYLLKFNYDKVISQHGFAKYGNGGDFAGLVWKANLQEILISTESKQQLPQIVYSKTRNLAFLLFTDTAHYFSVSEMETNQNKLSIYQVSTFISRDERGLTKEVEGYLFSAVGKAGLDIYKIQELLVLYQTTITFKDLNIFNHQLDLKDFAILKVDEGKYQFYLLDAKLGLVLAYMYINQDTLSFERVIEVEPIPNGIAVDTKNGQNVFAAFEDNGIHFYIEYYVDFTKRSYSIITKRESNYRILDVDATDEFAIISGVNNHQIVFQNGYDFIAPHKQQIRFSQIGMRDFEFFKYSYSNDDLKNAAESDEYQYDDFFFGVTATNAFLTKFKFVPASVVCFTDNKQLKNTKQFYSLQYNQSYISNNIVAKDKVIRTTKNFQVEVVRTFLFEQQINIIYVILIVLGFVIFFFVSAICYKFQQFRKEEIRLEVEIENKQKMNDSHNQIKFDESQVIQAP
ncbi:unnamed protein product (macronuclear) [Paramecium tetraurelia]|uniref:Transmembrane protein n=1 Tax=Paramecium tetraurelia TaxID=5888 RepID=A0D9A4_PARTE|nr:uncharacterized protein GSPATT00014551001 [Paramecium tetraurelia]CAK79621.1 unnamed protein product [Paramecium tetraurelia]|eukprot:XP_001447018.1 hypothetical protein (macronuclear) [Paramecium tetraurelia strain d4-2]